MNHLDPLNLPNPLQPPDASNPLSPLNTLNPSNPLSPLSPLSPLTAADRCLCTTTARLLAAVAAAAGALGLGCMLVAAVWLGLLAWHGPTSPASQDPMTAMWAMRVLVPVPVPVLVLVLVMMVLLERVLAMRLHFDAGLFAELARSDGAPASLQLLDQALHTLGLRRASAVCRPLLDRVQGAQRLARWHVATVALQVLALSGLLSGLWTGTLLGWGPA